MSAGEITAEATASLPDADIVVIGEVHDNPAHHRTQAEIVARLKPTAVVFEMLSPQQAAQITPELLSDPDALRRALDWEASGWPDFAIYAPVFAASAGARIYGAAVEIEEVRRAMSDGAAAVFGEGADRFGLAEQLDEAEQRLREAGQMEAHCNALPEDMLPGLVEAQRLRDARFARTVVGAREQHGAPVVLITGNGHARTDWGVPAVVRQAGDFSVLGIGQLEHREADPQFDFWIVTDPFPRPDPCLAFQ